MIINRSHYLTKVTESFEVHSVCALVGPRQCGKTTLASQFSIKYPEKVTFFDLEDIADLEKLQTPKLALDHLEGLVVFDEIQHRPDLFPYLRVLADRYPHRRYLILGSASGDLLQQSSETLAGRISYIEITPFQYSEVHELSTLMIRGGFPKSYLAKKLSHSLDWRKNYIATFLERDLPSFGIQLPPLELRRFWSMLAHYHGNTINYSEIARALGISDQSVRRYISILEGTFMVRTLKSWFENISKRQVKSPKMYIRDSGILLSLLGIEEQDILGHPKCGALWEGFAIEEIIRAHQINPLDCYFWGSPSVGELDLLFVQGLKRRGFEFKFTDAPKITQSMLLSMETLKLENLFVIIPGSADYFLHEKIHVLGLENYLEKIR